MRAMQRLGITHEYLIEKVKTILERCLQLEPVTDRSGMAAYVKFDAANALRAAELLARPLGAFPQRVEHTGEGGGAVQIDVNDRAAEARAKAAEMMDALAKRLRGDGAKLIEGAATEAQPAAKAAE